MSDAENINANVAYQNAWLVYINGIEVPVSSVSITYGVWQIPQADIVMVPEAILQRLGSRDRVSVQVFYCDQWIRPSKPEFRLLFDGEIIGWSYVNVQRSRSISFTAIDYIQIFTHLFFFFMSSVNELAIGTTFKDIGVFANGVTVPGFGPLWPYSLFAEGVMPVESSGNAQDVVTHSLIQQPIDYVYNVVRGLLGNYPGTSVPAAQFFAPWARRTLFANRFVALPYLESKQPNRGLFPILKAVQADWAVAAVARMTESIGSSGHIYGVFEEILKVLMMEIAMIPTAPAVQINLSDLRILGPATKTQEGKVAGLANYFVKPQFLFGVPPSCNVFFPSQVTQLAYQENYARQPTRMYFHENSWPQYLGKQSNDPTFTEQVRAALTVAHPEEVHLRMQETIMNPANNGKNVLVYPEEFFRGPVIDRREMPRWFLFLNKAKDVEGVTFDPKKATHKERVEAARAVHPVTEATQAIFKLYASYEYAKERYSRRSAGLSMAFNPYPVPGFPGAVFDRRTTRMDLVGYVMNVRHVLSSRSMTTDISMGYARTFQEMFTLMRDQIDAENQVINEKAETVVNEIKEGKRGLAAMADELDMQPVGLVAMGPAEIIPEIRDRIQNIQRAEEFYKTLFYAEAVTDQTDTTASEEIDASRLLDDPNNVSQPVAAPYAADDILPYLRKKTAAFHYNQIVRIQSRSSKKKKAIDIELAGIEQKNKIELVAILDKMRLGTADDNELAAVRNALQLDDIQQATLIDAVNSSIVSDPAALQNNVTSQRIDYLEGLVRNAVVHTNIEGDVDFTPHPHAAKLFEEYGAAMSYNARPICTLDEYVTFLGDRAAAEGRVMPGAALAADAERTFPAPYYRRIRKYKPGPPSVIPQADYANSPVVMSADGVTVLPIKRSEEDTKPPFIGPPPPPTPADTATVATAETPAASEPLVVQEHTTGDSTKPAQTTTAKRVTGVQDTFPETIQDWDAILLEYRRIVLTRLSPSR